MDSDGPPPLEDMTEILQQVNALREIKTKRAGENHMAKQKSNGHAMVNGTSVKEKNAGKVQSKNSLDSQDMRTKNKQSTDQSKTEQKTVESQSQSDKKTVKAKDSFGGMKKGFLFGGASKSKSTNSNNSNTSQHKLENNNEVKTNRTLEDVPFITKNEGQKNESLLFSEVQEAMEKTNSKLMENKDWVTDDLLQKLEKNEKLSKRLQNPMFLQAIGEFQKNPQEALKKYGSNHEIQEFFTEFCGLMGQHFTNLSDKQDHASGSESSTAPVITTTPATDGAQMSVRSSTNPNQATSSDERKMQEILSDPDIRVVLMDPKVQELFECLRNDPAKSQRLLQNASGEFKQKIQKLVNAGLLQFQ